MTSPRPFARASEILKSVELRPTRQRLALAKLLFEVGDRHVSAEQLHKETRQCGVKISLATVYNALHQFTEAGLVREVTVDAGRSYFDTNTTDHHHFFCEGTGELSDIPGEAVELSRLPKPPTGMAVDRIDVIVRLSRRRTRKIS
jgi:Fur family iron response transcriptional regulator